MILGINEEKFLTQEDDYKGGFDYSETFYCPYLNFCTEKAPSKQPGLVNSTALCSLWHSVTFAVPRAWGKGSTAEVESSQGRIHPT